MKFVLPVLLGALAASASHAAGPFVDDCGLLPPELVPSEPVPKKLFEQPLAPNAPPLVRTVDGRKSKAAVPGSATAKLRTGALTGKTVYLSPGHGFTWTDTVNAWRTQRGNTHQVVEDLVSVETLDQLLIPMLLNAGAYVVPVREADLNTRMVIVDEAEPGYVEVGSSALFMDSTVNGWGRPPSPMNGSTLPFSLGKNRLMTAASSATATATFTPNVPEDGFYNVYLAYTQFSGRVSDAHFVVRHAGGETHLRIDQKRHGGTWVLLGRFRFLQGADSSRGAVVAMNDSQEAGTISLDAVRWGGGMGDIARGTGPSVSGRPRFEESCRTYAQFAGAPATVFQASSTDRNADVSCRSRFAAWDHEAGEDAVYVAWHTNASAAGTSRGTTTYVYGPNAPDGTNQYTPCTPNTNTPSGCGAPGSDLLAAAVHAELVKDFRSGWGSTWTDQGIESAYFGELNPSNNPEMPSVLLEVAFHDNATDAAQLREPQFRYLAARAIAQGIIKYFAQKDGTTAVLPSEPPSAIMAVNAGGGVVNVSWQPPATDSVDLRGGAATSYRVYQSADGAAWDDGTETFGPSLTLSLAPNTTRYFRVSSLNAAGESFPSQVVGVGVTAEAAAPMLVVNGYERLDSALAKQEDLAAFDLASPLRVFIERMNDGSYVRRHGEAIAYAQVAFDSASAEALTAMSLSLAGYSLVDWFVGRGLEQGRAPTAAQQAAIRSHVEAGRHLFFSGSHVVSALAAGDANDQAFLSQVLHAAIASGVPSLSWAPTPDQLLAGLSDVALDDGLKGSFDTGASDVLAPNGGVLVATYGSGLGAAVMHEQTARVVHMGFPFETIVSFSQRAETMGKLLKFYGLISQEPPKPDAGSLEPVRISLAPGEYAAPKGCGCQSVSAHPGALLLLAIFVTRRRRA